MRLNDLSLDFAEAEVSSLLSKAMEANSDAQDACDYFAGILNCVLASLEKEQPYKRWCLDDLCCDELVHHESQVTIKGRPHWLTGGVLCSEFRLDVALDTHPLLYSCKFINRKKIKQVLYLGKTPEGWLINDA